MNTIDDQEEEVDEDLAIEERYQARLEKEVTEIEKLSKAILTKSEKSRDQLVFAKPKSKVNFKQLLDNQDDDDFKGLLQKKRIKRD